MARTSGRTILAHARNTGVAVLLAQALGSAGCAVEMQNTQPARDAAEAAKPPGSVYAGWRIFQDKCVACHGPAARGTDRGPDLLLRVNEMGSRRFVNLVLKRYDWSFQPADAAGREAMVDEVLQRRQGAMAMPAWQNEPTVNAHVLDLYAYLTARADGQLGTGRPPP